MDYLLRLLGLGSESELIDLMDNDSFRFIDINKSKYGYLKIDKLEIYFEYKDNRLIPMDWYYDIADEVIFKKRLQLSNDIVCGYDKQFDYYEFKLINNLVENNYYPANNLFKIRRFYIPNKIKIINKGYTYLGIPDEDGDNNGLYHIIGEIININVINNKYLKKPLYEIDVEVDYDYIFRLIVNDDILGRTPKVSDFIEAELIAYAKAIWPFRGYNEVPYYNIKTKEYPSIFNILDLYYVFLEYSKKLPQYINRSLLASLLINKLSEARIMKVENHYYNMLKGDVLDFCSDEFEFNHLKCDYDSGIVIISNDIDSKTLGYLNSILEEIAKKRTTRIS